MIYSNSQNIWFRFKLIQSLLAYPQLIDKCHIFFSPKTFFFRESHKFEYIYTTIDRGIGSFREIVRHSGGF